MNVPNKDRETEARRVEELFPDGFAVITDGPLQGLPVLVNEIDEQHDTARVCLRAFCTEPPFVIELSKLRSDRQ